MHEEVNQRVVSLSIRAGKLTADVLAKAVRMYLEAQRRNGYHCRKLRAPCMRYKAKLLKR